MNETIIQLIEENGIEPYKLRVPITQDELPLMVENTLSMSTMEGVGGAGAGAHTVTTTTTTTTTTATTTTAMTRRYYSNNNNNNTYPFIAKSPLDFIQYDTKMYDASTRLSPSSSGGGGGRNEEPLSCSGGASAASVNTLIPSLCVNKDNNPIQITTTTSFESLTCNHCGTSMHERFTSSSSHTNNVQYTFNPTLEEYNTKFNKGSFHVSKKDIFARQLTSSIQRCSPQIASSIVLNYSTPSSLYNAFKRHGEDALQYIPISTDNATQVPTRKVGKALSKNIYATFMK
ncbi:hypothetical protein C9374_007344 [Naegleria lovaniensis]|uniref:Uncharacterized protein n=1 Tax=Naegleria lovaniensis TaxID=51637 RepID=A0AA88GLY4_NAELO|nr:uncharacterized protein C9374_007344 [Naegleria lovaniensis]KAG2379205.1 hypothetical protein C9374_007344 [Naegleria lovaniensis]